MTPIQRDAERIAERNEWHYEEQEWMRDNIRRDNEHRRNDLRLGQEQAWDYNTHNTNNSDGQHWWVYVVVPILFVIIERIF